MGFGTLSNEVLEHLAESREQQRQDETVSQDEVKEPAGVDD
jgi:PHD/YefM family antitoxin component YafN of YafNO toxin-antitoxin module